MTSNPSNENDRMILRIERAMPRITGESVRVLTYIKRALTPEAIAERHEDDKSVGHLRAVAKQHLKPYEKEPLA